MATKTKRKRIIKPVVKEKSPVQQRNEYYAGEMLKKTEEILQPDKPVIDVRDELITVPSCDGCFFYNEPDQRCNDTESRDCTGVIFVKK